MVNAKPIALAHDRNNRNLEFKLFKTTSVPNNTSYYLKDKTTQLQSTYRLTM